jgi:hypothetical protein
MQYFPYRNFEAEMTKCLCHNPHNPHNLKLLLQNHLLPIIINLNTSKPSILSVLC